MLAKATTAAVPPSLTRFAAAHPRAEVWWDAHPDTEQTDLPEALRPGAEPSLIRGVTTNPSLLARSITHTHHDSVQNALDDALTRAARRLAPVHAASGGQAGFVSAQLLPDRLDDADAMLAEALRLRALADNVMVKVPATAAGLVVLEALTARGVPTNVTLTYTVAQCAAALDALARGLDRASTPPPRTVITFMCGRFGAELQRRAPGLSPADVRTAELWCMRTHLDLVAARGLPTQLLLCSLRTDTPETSLDGSFCAHVEYLVGEPAVLTCPPALLADLCAVDDGAHRTRDLVPDRSTRRRLQAHAWVRDALDPDGIAPERFIDLPPLRHNAAQHLAALADLGQRLGVHT